MTDQYTAAEVIEFANKMRELGLEVADAYLFNPSYMTSGEKALGFGTQSRTPNSVANELIGLGLVGLWVGGFGPLLDWWGMPESRLYKITDCDDTEYIGPNPLAAVVAACVACLSLKEQQQ